MSSKIVLIIQREFNQRVRKRSFILTTILMPLLLVGVMAIPVLIAVYGSSPSVVRQIVVVDSSGVVAPALVDSPSLSFTPTTLSCDSARRAAEYGEAFGFLTVGPRVVEDPSQVALYTRENSTRAIEDEIREQIRRIVYQQRIERADIPGLDSILQQLQVRPVLATYRIDEQAAGGDTARQSSSDLLEALSFGMGIIIYMFIFIYGAAIMQGVIEEKNNRIVEVIVSSVRPFQLMMGKIVGMTLVALTQLAIWAILVVGAFEVMRSSIPADGGAMNDGLLAAFSVFNASTILSVGGLFLLFFVGGYMLYASMFAAVGSAVENVQDAQQLQMPVTIPLVLAFLVLTMVMRDPTSAVAFWFSIIPFTSPIVMIARLPYGVPLWEMVLSLVLLYATFLLVVSLAARIFRIGIFMYGKKPTLGEILRWIRYKG
ncbi:ABC transporter permease [Millionella massiliensis]|uniref:ABC transporter permease n=1 Tax=Millionella massiliensis TaxID=1871023 RepID=UPI0008D9D29F|nr:ABC transporter permease [Millionella massiliensis]